MKIKVNQANGAEQEIEVADYEFLPTEFWYIPLGKEQEDWMKIQMVESIEITKENKED